MSRRAITVCVSVFFFSVIDARAAEPSRDLGQIRAAPNTVVYVRTMNGAEVQGRLVRASAQALVVTAPDGRDITFPADQVMFVWKRGDSVRNGAIIGGLVGLAGGILGQSGCTDCSSEVALGIGLGVPIWAGVGALVDRQRVGRTLVYRAP